MAAKSWTLIDVESEQYVDDFSIGPHDVPDTPEGWAVSKRTLRGGKRDGVDVVEIDNGEVQIVVVPTRGMGVHRMRRRDELLGWQSPVRGPVHPQWVPLAEESGLGWLDGFDELLVRCGLESNGAPDFDDQGKLKYGLHGRIANRPAHRVTVAVDPAAGEIAVSGVVEEARFHFFKLRLTAMLVTRFGESGFRLRDTVENFSGVEADMQLLYHINFGIPLLDAGARLVAPIKTLVPRNEYAAGGVENWNSYPPEQPGAEEQVYFAELAHDDGLTRVLLKNAHATAGAVLAFDTRQLPCFTQWKNTPAAADGYVTGLEPGTNYPNPRTHEKSQRRVATLGPGQRRHFDLELLWLPDAEKVAIEELAIAKLQATVEPKIHNSPQPGWCAPG